MLIDWTALAKFINVQNLSITGCCCGCGCQSWRRWCQNSTSWPGDPSWQLLRAGRGWVHIVRRNRFSDQGLWLHSWQRFGVWLVIEWKNIIIITFIGLLVRLFHITLNSYNPGQLLLRKFSPCTSVLVFVNGPLLNCRVNHPSQLFSLVAIWPLNAFFWSPVKNFSCQNMQISSLIIMKVINII